MAYDAAFPKTIQTVRKLAAKDLSAAFFAEAGYGRRSVRVCGGDGAKKTS